MELSTSDFYPSATKSREVIVKCLLDGTVKVYNMPGVKQTVTYEGDYMTTAEAAEIESHIGGSGTIMLAAPDGETYTGYVQSFEKKPMTGIGGYYEYRISLVVSS